MIILDFRWLNYPSGYESARAARQALFPGGVMSSQCLLQNPILGSLVVLHTVSYQRGARAKNNSPGGDPYFWPSDRRPR